MNVISDEIKDYVVKMRRALHRIPELSDEEFETGKFLAARLKEMGLKYRCIHTGLYADMAGVDKTRTVALRCDMDALPVSEKTDLDFKAEKNMHACGHDGHMAIVLGVAKLLTTRKPDCNVRLIFQFGEEGDGGADKMIKKGVLDGVDEIYAFHLCPELEKGKLASCEGAMFAGTVEFDVLIAGQSSHCADREKGKDALLSVRDFLSAYPDVNSQHALNTLFHIGRVDCGSARNVVADSAKIYCTLRYFDSYQSEAVMMNVSRLLAKADKLHGTDSKVVVNAVYPPLINSSYALSRVKEVAEVLNCKPRYTAEDFAFYTQKVMGCMTWLGVKDEKHFSPLHSDTFGFDESALFVGVETMFKLVCKGE